MNRALFFGLAGWVGLACAVSCSSSDKARHRGRVEHPADPGPPAAPPETDPLEPSAAPAEYKFTPAPSTVLPSPSQQYEQLWGAKLSPLDKAIMDACPPRAWSKKVPTRRCKKDGECGDGFCDRGRCAAIWSCGSDYGQRCEENAECGPRPCIDGRCRSCAVEADCDWKLGRFRSVGGCREDSFIDGAHACVAAPLPAPPFATNLAPSPPPVSVTSSLPPPVSMNDCPMRAWSKKVPKRSCTKDAECDDGFCDRGRCAAVWTCTDYGGPCKKSDDCGTRPCIDGRCRSCTSETDCDFKRGRDVGESEVRCRAEDAIPGARECMGQIGSVVGGVGSTEPVRPPPPPTP